MRGCLITVLLEIDLPKGLHIGLKINASLCGARILNHTRVLLGGRRCGYRCALSAAGVVEKYEKIIIISSRQKGLIVELEHFG